MNTREQVEQEIAFTELRGEIAGLKERLARLEDAKSQERIPAYEVTYVVRGSNVITHAFLVYKMSEAYQLVENAPSGVSIEIRPMSREELARPDEGVL